MDHRKDAIDSWSGSALPGLSITKHSLSRALLRIVQLQDHDPVQAVQPLAELLIKFHLEDAICVLQTIKPTKTIDYE